MPSTRIRCSPPWPPWIASRNDCSPLLPPTSIAVAGTTMPGVSAAHAPRVWLVGTESRMAFGITLRTDVFCVSTIGLWPDTVIVSWSSPTCSSTLIGAVKFAGSSTPSRFTAPKPVNVNVTLYRPGVRFTSLY